MRWLRNRRRPNATLLMRLIKVVRRLGRAVRQMGLVPGGDLVLPADERAAKGAHLHRAGLVLEVAPETFDEGQGEVGVVVVVDAANDLLGVPGGAHLASGFAGVEEPEEINPAVVLEAFVGPGEQAAGPVQGVVLLTTNDPASLYEQGAVVINASSPAADGHGPRPVGRGVLCFPVIAEPRSSLYRLLVGKDYVGGKLAPIAHLVLGPSRSH